MCRKTFIKAISFIFICLTLTIGFCVYQQQVTIFASEEEVEPVVLTEKQSGSLYTVFKNFMDSFARISMQQMAKKEQLEQLNQEALLYFVGDIMSLGGQQRSVKAKGYSFDSSFCYIKDQLLKADFVCGNLETQLSASHPTTEEQNLVNDNPNCNTKASFATALKVAGFSAVTTANNHTYDWGKKGAAETLSVLDELQIPQTGMLTETSLPYLMTEVKGINVAVLAYTELINSRSVYGPTECGKAIHCYSAEQVEKDIRQAKEAGADVVVVCIHWGKENTTEVTDRQKQHANEIATAGADVIIGTHPHCLQKAEFIDGTDGKKVLCIYSMGNFVSSMVRESNKQSILLAIRVYKDKEQSVHLSYAYEPIYTMGALDGNPFTVVPTNLEGESEEIQTKLFKAEQEIKAVIGDAIPLQRQENVIPQDLPEV